MAYCRFGDDSDVYLYNSGDVWSCCGCKLADGGERLFSNLTDVLAHLDEHATAGHRVDGWAVARVRWERENGATLFGRPLPAGRL